MINFIAHRINTIKDISNLDSQYGVEIDLRDNVDGRIYLQHDPFISGDDFEEYCKAYHHGIMILNIKSERIEYKAIEILQKYKISNYFFLDSSFPMIYTLAMSGNTNLALRFSEYEGFDTIRNMAGKANWIWVDCFTKLPLDASLFKELKLLQYKICLVSPELQNHVNCIESYAKKILQENIMPNAICTKVCNIDKWKKFLSLE